jgi:diguanylate cyclase (GGDEF)-like protein
MSEHRSPTIRGRLALLVLASAAPAVLLGGVLLAFDYRADRERLESASIATARAMAHSIDHELISITSAAQVLATSQRLGMGDFTAFRAQAQEVMSQRIATNVVVTGADGRQLVNTLRPAGEALPMHGNPAQLRAVFETARPVISDLYIGGVLRRPVVSVDAPVVRDGKVMYALSIGEVPERFLKILREEKLPADWIGAVFDRKGTIVARTHQHAEFVGKSGSPALVERMSREAEGTLESVTLEGIPVVSVFSRAPTSGWTVAIGIPREEITRQIWRRSAVLGMAAIVVVALGLALAWGIGGSIAASIRGLEEPASQIGRREEIRVPPLGLREADEVGQALVRAAHMIAIAQHRAQHDPLTGLANRSLFLEMAVHNVETSKRTGAPLTVLFIDLDGFKRVNDTLGHDVGDLVLCDAAERLRSAVRSSDVVARVGGDEFAVLLQGVTPDEGAAFAFKLAGILSAPYEAAGERGRISASIGSAAFPQSGESAQDLIKRADEAMYRVKAAKRDP